MDERKQRGTMTEMVKEKIEEEIQNPKTIFKDVGGGRWKTEYNDYSIIYPAEGRKWYGRLGKYLDEEEVYYLLDSRQYLRYHNSWNEERIVLGKFKTLEEAKDSLKDNFSEYERIWEEEGGWDSFVKQQEAEERAKRIETASANKKEKEEKKDNGPINLNTATIEVLQTLPRIGKAKAETIIKARPYKNVDDLLNVKGVGAKMVESLRCKITV